MSLDGFITGPNVRVGNGLGDGGDRLHDWMFDTRTEADAKIVAEIYGSTGAVVMGKRMFEVGFEPWGDPPPFGMPVFVMPDEARDPECDAPPLRGSQVATAGPSSLDILPELICIELTLPGSWIGTETTP